MKHLLYFLLAAVLIISCKDDPEEITPDPGGGGDTIVFVTEDINVATTWYSDSIYVIDNYDFYVNATLTIQAGTIIKFQPTEGPYLGLGSGGTIVANGSASKPIIFTSYKDDVHGGDTNGDGSATSPNPGDWHHININDENGSEFNYCEFYYGGGGSYNYTLTLFGSQNSRVTYCTFAHNRGGKDGGFYYGALDASQAEEGTIIAYNVFYDNTLPLSVSTSFNLNNSNQFHNPSVPGEINTMNGIFVYAIDEISNNLLWEETEVPFVINDGDLWVNSGFTLSLADAVILKFTSASTLLLTDGASALDQGSANYFTSFKDDNLKGDTNGDGDATSPADGDWEGIYDDFNSVFFTWGNIYYVNH